MAKNPLLTPTASSYGGSTFGTSLGASMGAAMASSMPALGRAGARELSREAPGPAGPPPSTPPRSVSTPERSHRSTPGAKSPQSGRRHFGTPSSGARTPGSKRGKRRKQTPVKDEDAFDKMDTHTLMLSAARRSRSGAKAFLAAAPPALRADKDFALAAVRSAGEALEVTPPALRADKDVVLEAVRSDGRAIRFADYALQADPDVCSEAVHQRGRALMYCAPEKRVGHDLGLAAVRADGTAFPWTGSCFPFPADHDIVFTAVEQCRVFRPTSYARELPRGSTPANDALRMH